MTAKPAPHEYVNPFIGMPKPPTDAALTAALGRARPVWDKLLARLASGLGVAAADWHSYSPKAGWTLRLRHNGRTIVYLAPAAGAFRASFALGDKAVQAALQARLPARVLTAIRTARRYAEGTAVRLEVRTAADVAAVVQLARIKLEH